MMSKKIVSEGRLRLEDSLINGKVIPSKIILEAGLLLDFLVVDNIDYTSPDFVTKLNNLVGIYDSDESKEYREAFIALSYRTKGMGERNVFIQNYIVVDEKMNQLMKVTLDLSTNKTFQIPEKIKNDLIANIGIMSEGLNTMVFHHQEISDLL